MRKIVGPHNILSPLLSFLSLSLFIYFLRHTIPMNTMNLPTFANHVVNMLRSIVYGAAVFGFTCGCRGLKFKTGKKKEIERILTAVSITISFAFSILKPN